MYRVTDIGLSFGDSYCIRCVCMAEKWIRHQNSDVELETSQENSTENAFSALDCKKLLSKVGQKANSTNGKNVCPT